MLSLIIGALGAIGSAALAVTQALAVVGMAVEGLKVVGTTLLGILKAAGIIQTETKVEELGEKALQAAEDPDSGIVFEDYDSFEEYVKDVDKYVIDPEKSKLHTEQEKVEKGLQLVSGLVIDKMPEIPIVEFFKMVIKAPEYFNEARLKEIVKYIVPGDSTLKDVIKFMDGTEKNTAKLESVENKLISLEKTINPLITNSKALDIIYDTKKHLIM